MLAHHPAAVRAGQIIPAESSAAGAVVNARAPQRHALFAPVVRLSRAPAVEAAGHAGKAAAPDVGVGVGLAEGVGSEPGANG